MKKLLIAFMLLTGCDNPPPPAPYFEKDGWTMIEAGPEGGNGFYGIYKKHSEKERATFYMTKVHYGWSISVVPDRNW
jgi:hypothetical protein